MITDPVLASVCTAEDQTLLIEIYAPDTVPTVNGFDPANALKRFAAVAGVTFAGQVYTRLIKAIGKTSRTTTESANTFQFTLDNLTGEPAEFENDFGFEGCIVVQRLISRSLSVNLAASKIQFAGQCEKPTTGSRAELPITARGILSSIDVSIPRRRYQPTDQEGRIASDPLFEGFRHMPQYTHATYSERVRRGGLMGLLGFKKTVTRFIQWSSFSDIDAENFVPFLFGRVQVAGTHAAYQDVGYQIQITTILGEGPVEDMLNVRSDNSEFPIHVTSGINKMYGELGGTSDAVNGRYQLGNRDNATGIIYPDHAAGSGGEKLSRSAVLFLVCNGTQLNTVDAAPNIIVVTLGQRVTIPDAAGVWNVPNKWSDNAAALTRHVFTSPDWYGLHANWIDDADAAECYRFNNSTIFDSANSDILFIPQAGATRTVADVNEPVNVPVENDRSRFLLSTGLYTENTHAFLTGEKTAAEAFTVSPYWTEYDAAPDARNIPIDPPDPGDPDNPPGGGGSTPTPGLVFYLRRRYTCNVVVTEESKLVDFLHKVVFPSARMYLTQGPTGRLRMKNKKPADNALSTGAVTGSAVSVDNAAPWVTDRRGLVVIDPNIAGSEIRKVTAAAYSGHNAIVMTASANITVTAFAGGTASAPAAGKLTVTATGLPAVSHFVIAGERVDFTPGSADTLPTIAGFIYGSINAHPRLSRRFKAAWTAGNAFVDIAPLFGDLTLDAAVMQPHPAGVIDPAAAPVIAAAAGGTLTAGVYNVCYCYRNHRGQTLPSPKATVNVAANQKIDVSAVVPPAGASVDWYVSPGPNSQRLRLHTQNNGAAFSITAAPLLTATLLPEVNRTSAEILRVEGSFSDRAEPRSHAARSNVLKASFRWRLGNQDKPYNRVDLKWRDASQDHRITELRIKDQANVDKTKKTTPFSVNGAAIDNYNQAYRIAAGQLAEFRDADFFFEWQADREAVLYEEGDIVAVTHDAAKTFNLPVRIESIEYTAGNGFLSASFVGRKYATSLYDDSVAEREIPVVIENRPPAANDVFANVPRRPLLAEKKKKAKRTAAVE